MSDKLTVVCVSPEGINLFTLDFVPHPGTQINYSVDWNSINKLVYTQDAVDFWMQLDQKIFVAGSSWVDVRNFDGAEKSTVFVNVTLIEKNKEAENVSDA